MGQDNRYHNGVEENEGSKLKDLDRSHEHNHHDDHLKRPELFQPMELEIVWGNVFRMAILHALALAGLFWAVSGRTKLLTILFGKLHFLICP